MNKQRIEKPNFTTVPNAIFDIMAEMDKSEIKVVLAICRKTFGWHKTKDRISFSQIAEMTGLNNSGVQRGIESSIERGVVLRNPTGNSFEYEIAIYDEEDSTTMVPKSVPPRYRKDEKSVPPRYVQKKVLKETKDISANAEKPSPDGEIDFPTAEPRRDHSDYKTSIPMAISEFERTGGKPEVSSPRQAEKTFTAKYAPIMAELMGRVYPIDEDRRCAKKLFGKHLDETRINERLNAYRNGEGERFRKPDATAYWIVNQLEKDLSVKLESSELRVTSRGRNLADY